MGQHQEDWVQATSAESQGNAKRLACTSKRSHWYILVLCTHSHRRRRSVLGYSLAVKPENADTYIQSGRIWLRLFTAEIKAEVLIACVQTKDRKRSSNWNASLQKFTSFTVFLIPRCSRWVFFKKRFPYKIPVTAHDLEPLLSSQVSQAPLLISKHYIIHFSSALSGCWIRMWKSAGCELKKHTRCLLIAAVADLAVPMVHTATGSCITYRFTSWEVWCVEIWFDRSQNCLVEGCGSWKLEAGFLPPPTFFFF